MFFEPRAREPTITDPNFCFPIKLFFFFSTSWKEKFSFCSSFIPKREMWENSGIFVSWPEAVGAIYRDARDEIKKESRSETRCWRCWNVREETEMLKAPDGCVGLRWRLWVRISAVTENEERTGSVPDCEQVRRNQISAETRQMQSLYLKDNIAWCIKNLVYYQKSKTQMLKPWGWGSKSGRWKDFFKKSF